MKETIKINLGQRLYDLDIDAYHRLKIYLDSLKKYFQRSPKEADEILQDIEQRMADMLEEKLTDKKQIITSDDIAEVIKMMGTIEDFELESETSESDHSSENKEEEKFSDPDLKENRRMFRDIDNNLLGGVCSGMASYFNIDTVWIRLAFVLLFFLKGAGVLAYIILWFAVPAARTTAQKLQMKGRPVNVENIEKSVKDEFKKVKENLKYATKSDSFKRMQSVSAEIFETLGSIFLVILKAILVIIGIIFLFVGIFFILGFFAIVPFDHLPHIPFQNLPYWDHLTPLTHNMSLFTFALIIVILIPVMGILASSIRFIFNVKRRNGVLSAFSWTIWSLALVFILVTLISGEKIFSFEDKTGETSKLKVAFNKPLYVDINEPDFQTLRISHFNIFGREILHNKETDECFIQPHFLVSNSNDSLFYLEISRISSLTFSKEYKNNYSQDYNWQLDDSVLILNKYFKVDDDYIWTMPGMNIILKVPKGKKVVMRHDANLLFETIEKSKDRSPDKEVNF